MEKSVVFQNKKIFYKKEGNGPALLFLHGFLENHSIWNGFIDGLKENYTCIAVDLPGFGKTEVFSENHTMNFMADTVKAVIDAENIKKTVVTGHSMGGYVSLAFAKKFPSLVKGLVLFHSQAAADDPEAKTNRNRTIEIVKKEHKNFISSFIPLLFAEQNIEKFKTEIEKLKETSLKTSAEGVIAALAGMRDREENTTLLKEAGFPVFFVVGKQDSRIPVDKVISQIALPKHSESIILDEVGHMGFIEAPKIIFPVLTGFYGRCLG